MDTIKIGSFQGEIREGEVDANLKKVGEVFQANHSLDFLCFPETYITGYSQEAVEKCSLKITDKKIRNLIAATKGSECVLLVGMSENRLGEKVNTQLVIKNGALLGQADKCMLTLYDKTIFASTLKMPVFESKGVKFGICICHTTSFPEPAQLLSLQGARLLFTPHYNNIPAQTIVNGKEYISFAEHRRMVLNNQAALATMFKMVVVRSNILSFSKQNLGSGDSNIWDMDGNLVAEGRMFAEEVVRADFDREIFLKTHFIDRKELSMQLFDKIYSSAKKYLEG